MVRLQVVRGRAVYDTCRALCARMGFAEQSAAMLMNSDVGPAV
jgi:hypothetical protein